MLNLQPIEYIGRRPSPKAKRKGPGFFGGWFLLLLVIGITAYFVEPMIPFLKAQRSQPSASNAAKAIEELRASERFSDQLAAAALERTKENVTYDSGYYDLTYPGGDLPSDKGNCTDLVVRSYRVLGFDLQELVHEDMKEHFRLYPQLWELKGPDTNIDHRRVPNLQRYFARSGAELESSVAFSDYQIGDVIAWRLPYGQNSDGGSHIGIVVPGPGARSHEKWVVHNVGSGPAWEDKLFSFDIVGHYRFGPDHRIRMASSETETEATATTSATVQE